VLLIAREHIFRAVVVTCRCLINRLEDALLEQIFGTVPFEDRCCTSYPFPTPLPSHPLLLEARAQLLIMINMRCASVGFGRHLYRAGHRTVKCAASQVDGATARQQALGLHPSAAISGMGNCRHPADASTHARSAG